jgi:MFS family permease
MSAKSVSISSMFGWIVDAFRLFKKNPGSLIGAGLLTILCFFALMLPMWLLMFGSMYRSMASGGMMAGQAPMMGDNMTMFFGLYGLTLVLSLALFPPMLMGWFRMYQAIDRGDAVGATDIFKPYRDADAWWRGIRYALLIMVIYIGVIGLFMLAFMGPFVDFQQQMMANQAAALSGAAPTPPMLPAAFWLAYAGMFLVLIPLQFVYMLGFTEVSLRPTSALEALRLGAIGTARNLLKLLVFTLLASMFFGTVIVCIVLVLALLVWVLSLASSVLAVVAVIVLYFVVLLCLYPLMFAGHYFAWKSVLGDDGAPTESAVSA